MQLKYNDLEQKCTSEARQLRHDIEMTIKSINVIQCCKQLRDKKEEAEIEPTVLTRPKVTSSLTTLKKGK